jgi:hypothetical protein
MQNAFASGFLHKLSHDSCCCCCCYLTKACSKHEAMVGSGKENAAATRVGFWAVQPSELTRTQFTWLWWLKVTRQRFIRMKLSYKRK